MSASETLKPRFVIEAGQGSFFRFQFLELWRRRELVILLTSRDLKLRYKQTFLGVAWSILQPVLSVGVFTLFLGRLAKVPSDGIPYAVFSFSGIILWNYFSNALSRCGNSLVANSHLIGKVYFPRLLIPIAGLFPGLVDFAIALIGLFATCLYFGQIPKPLFFFYLPFAVAMVALLALGAGLWLSALNVRFRDVSHMLPFFLQLWMFSTPILYPLDLVPERFRVLAGINPMVGFTESFRASLLGLPWNLPVCAASVVTTAVLLVTGAIYFLHVEKDFADVV